MVLSRGVRIDDNVVRYIELVMYIYYLSHSTLALSFSTYLLVLLAMLLLATGVL